MASGRQRGVAYFVSKDHPQYKFSFLLDRHDGSGFGAVSEPGETAPEFVEKQKPVWSANDVSGVEFSEDVNWKGHYE